MKKWIIIFLGAFLWLAGCEKKVKISEQELEQEFNQAEQAYQELLANNPPTPYTYHYRNLISQAEQAKAKGELEKAYQLAQQAEEQASLALVAWRQELARVKEKLEQAKNELEGLFPINHYLISRYWELYSRFRAKKYEGLEQELDKLLSDIEQEKKSSVFPERKMTVVAPEEYIKRWGNVRVYQEITPEGKLRGVIERVPPGMQVKVLKIKIFSPDLIFCYVEVPLSGKQGWMLEKYLSYKVGEFSDEGY